MDNSTLQEINAEKQKFLEVIKLGSHPGYVEVVNNVKKMRDDVALDLANEKDTTKILALHSQWVYANELYDYLSTVPQLAENAYYEAFGVNSDVDILVNQ